MPQDENGEAFGKKALRGVFWSAIERFSVQGVQFLFMLIIARILAPRDYGIVATITIILTLSQVFVDSGFSNALIRKKNRTEEDLFSVLVFNLGTSACLFIFIYLAAPALARLNRAVELIGLIRVSGITLLLLALATVPRTILTIEVAFAKLARASVVGALINGIVSIILAKLGFGPWSLVYGTICGNAVTTIITWIVCRWRPKGGFSFASLKEMFGFGSRLLLSSVIDSVYNNMQKLVIGAHYSQQELAFYTRADQFCAFPSANVSAILSRVTYPMLCALDDMEAKKSAFEKFLRVSAFVVFPTMLLLAALSSKLINLLLGAKWIETAPLMAILSLSYLLYPIHAMNLSMLLVQGRSDRYFRIEIAKKIIGVATIIATANLGVTAMSLGVLAMSIVSLVANGWFAREACGNSLAHQLKTLLPAFLCSAGAGLTAFWISGLFISTILGFLFGLFAGLATYAALTVIFCRRDLISLKAMKTLFIRKT